MKPKLIRLLTALITTLVIVMPAHAADSDLSVRLQEPQSPTNKKDFPLGFVALDIQGRAMTVKCFYKGPSDGGFTQFDTVALIAGGTSGSCHITHNQINPLGTYQFKAEVTAGGDGPVVSNVESLEYDNHGPDAPTNYQKQKIGSCTIRLNFKTADDGETTKVVIYRSESTSFTLDGNTKVGEVALGPNQEGQFEENPPDCSKTYYYAIRAFDDAGNGSSPVGDAGITTTIGSVAGATTGGGAIPVSAGQSQVSQGSVLGQTDEAEASDSAGPEIDAGPATTTHEGEVAGETTQTLWQTIKDYQNYLIGFGIVIALGLLWFVSRRR